MKPTPTQLAYCLAQLTRFIPTPPKPRAREQKSKWGLKAGDLLSRDGTLWTVSSTDSLGVNLESQLEKGFVARIEEREALEPYQKQPRRRGKGKQPQVREDGL